MGRAPLDLRPHLFQNATLNTLNYCLAGFHTVGRAPLDLRPHLFQNATTSQLQAFFNPRSNLRGPTFLKAVCFAWSILSPPELKILYETLLRMYNVRNTLMNVTRRSFPLYMNIIFQI